MKRKIQEPKTRSRKSSSTSKKDPEQVLINLLPDKSDFNIVTNEDSNPSGTNCSSSL